MKISNLQIFLVFQYCASLLHSTNAQARYKYIVQEAPFTRICRSKDILTVNGQFPGPTLFVQKGETIIVDVINNGRYNVTIHWHGVAQPRNPWSDGPEFITQCPIQPGQKFTQKVIFSTEEGTVWWHAHSDWSRATVHGAIIVKPKAGTSYPFPKPYAEVPIIIGNWWIQDIMELYKTYVTKRVVPPVSNAFLINGQPGDFFPCSRSGTFTLNVDEGQTYMLRIVNAAIESSSFFGIANHKLTVVGSDGSYTKPFETDYIVMAPGQTIDVLFDADQIPNKYYMALRVYDGGYPFVPLDYIITTAILQYNGAYDFPFLIPPLPNLPFYGDTNATIKFASSMRSLADQVNVPLTIDKHLMMTVSMNLGQCVNNSCDGRRSSEIGYGASMSNISFMASNIDILRAYYNHVNGVYDTDFPDAPKYYFDFTADRLPSNLWSPKLSTEVNVLEYNTNVELVFQSTSLVLVTDHPMHLHGYSFYVVGIGLGNFDKDKDPLNYNLVDPPLVNTINVPVNGWTTVRFKADNPGVWFMHCHLEIHSSWGMEMAFIVKDGKSADQKMLPPPSNMPPC